MLNKLEKRLLFLRSFFTGRFFEPFRFAAINNLPFSSTRIKTTFYSILFELLLTLLLYWIAKLPALWSSSSMRACRILSSTRDGAPFHPAPSIPEKRLSREKIVCEGDISKVKGCLPYRLARVSIEEIVNTYLCGRIAPYLRTLTILKLGDDSL